MNTSQLVGPASSATGAASPPPAPRRLSISALTLSGVILFRKLSFCDAITSPVILSLPVENSFIASAFPVAMARKSASDIIKMHPALPWAPGFTDPAPSLRSRVQVLSGPVSLNWNSVFTLLPIPSSAATKAPMALNRSALVGSRRTAAALSSALGFGFGFGISEYSSIAALEITTDSRSLARHRKMIRVSDSFHISVTRVSPGNTWSANRTWMLLK